MNKTRQGNNIVKDCCEDGPLVRDLLSTEVVFELRPE